MAQAIGTHKHFDRLEAGPDRAANASVIRMVGQSAEMLQVFEQIRRAAVSDCTVVISGESGTGKELVAAALHGFSRRASGPFVDVNTAAIPESLVESELFGHVKGAYTGATSDRTGRLLGSWWDLLKPSQELPPNRLRLRTSSKMHKRSNDNWADCPK